MQNRRKYVRLNVADFLDIRLLDNHGADIKGKVENFSVGGICFLCEMQWQKGQVLLIDYFMPETGNSVKLEVKAAWSEFVSSQHGYICGCEIANIEKEREEEFTSYYLNGLRRKLNKEE